MGLTRPVLILVLAVGATAARDAGAQHVPPSAATAAQKSEAQAKYAEGVRLFEAGRKAEALAAFRASYATVASPNSLLMVARMQAELGDVASAFETYEAVERAARDLAHPKYRAAGTAARQERDELRAKVAMITLRVVGAPAGTRVTLAGREVPAEQWGSAIPVTPGDVQAVATLPGGRSVEQRVKATAGGASEIALDLAAPPPPIPTTATPPAGTSPTPVASYPPIVAPPEPGPEGPHRSLIPYAIAAGAVGVTGLGIFAVAGAMNRATYDDLQARCPNKICTADAREDVDAGRREQTVANVGAVLAVAGLGAGVALLIVDRSRAPAAGRGGEASGLGRRRIGRPSRRLLMRRLVAVCVLALGAVGSCAYDYDAFELVPVGPGSSSGPGAGGRGGGGLEAGGGGDGGAAGRGHGGAAASGGASGGGVCPAGLGDCNGNPADGCETDVTANPTHCGACGRACSSLRVASLQCQAGQCVSTCAIGFANCVVPVGSAPDDGCETDASDDASNCGGCGNACSLQGDAPGDHLVCDGGSRPKNHCGCSNNKQCRIGSAGGSCNGATGRCSCSGQVCHEGEACISGGVGNACSCNGNAACAAGEACCQTPSGCFDLLTHPASCGACGHACPTGFACVAGECACTADDQCNAGSPGAAACSSAVCACGGVGCAVGQRCQPDGACG